MKRLFLLPAFLLLAVASLYSQDIYDPDDEGDEYEFSYTLNEPGDQLIKVSLNLANPIKPENLKLGGSGSLGYHRYLNPWFSLGVDICFGYNTTIGSNVFTYIPFIFDATYAPTIGKFEFPVTLGIGFAVENYLSMTYFPGLIIKPQIGAFYRIKPSWSLGIQCDYMFMPQWYSKHPEYNYNGHFFDGGISVRYHF